MLSSILVTFVQTVKENFFSWSVNRTKSFKDNLAELPEEDEENTRILEQKIRHSSNIKSSVIKFVNSYDTTIYQSRLTHMEPLVETSMEKLGKINRSQGNKYEIAVLNGNIVDLETKR